jgi:hypothetical protein
MQTLVNLNVLPHTVLVGTMISSEFLAFMKRIIVEEKIPHMSYAMIAYGPIRLFGSVVTIDSPDMIFAEHQKEEYQLHNVKGTVVTFNGNGYWFVVTYEDDLWKLTRKMIQNSNA